MRVRPTRALPAELRRAAPAALTYPDVGATAGDLPTGYQHLRHRLLLGHGSAVLDRAEVALLQWEAQSGAGLIVEADGPVEPDRTVVLGLGRPLSLVIPCRVVWTLHTERRRGFAYGTLPGHPESGEECFLLDHGANDEVWLTIAAFTRPGDALVRAFGPVGPTIQRFYVRRYATAIRRSVRSADSSPD